MIMRFRTLLPHRWPKGHRYREPRWRNYLRQKNLPLWRPRNPDQCLKTRSLRCAVADLETTSAPVAAPGI